MNKINFVNNTTPALNAANLNQMQTNIENAINAKPDTKFKRLCDDVDVSAVNGTISLSESIANYDLLLVGIDYLGDKSYTVGVWMPYVLGSWTSGLTCRFYKGSDYVTLQVVSNTSLKIAERTSGSVRSITGVKII